MMNSILSENYSIKEFLSPNPRKNVPTHGSKKTIAEGMRQIDLKELPTTSEDEEQSFEEFLSSIHRRKLEQENMRNIIGGADTDSPVNLDSNLSLSENEETDLLSRKMAEKIPGPYQENYRGITCNTRDGSQNYRYGIILENIDKAIKLKPGVAAYYGVRAQVHYCCEDYEKSAADINKAIELNPENARFFIERAKLHRRQKKLDTALVDCSKAIELEPDNKTCYSERALVYILLGESKKADADFKRAYEVGLKSSTVR